MDKPDPSTSSGQDALMRMLELLRKDTPDLLPGFLHENALPALVRMIERLLHEHRRLGQYPAFTPEQEAEFTLSQLLKEFNAIAEEVLGE